MPAFELPTPSDHLLDRYGARARDYRSYPAPSHWRSDFGPEDYTAHLKAAAVIDEPLALYVHLPFCQGSCGTCGDDVVLSTDPHAVDPYLAILERELALVAQGLSPDRNLSQVSFGGGALSFLSEAQLQRLWNAVTRTFQVQPDAERRVELHAAGTPLAQLQRLRALGFKQLILELPGAGFLSDAHAAGFSSVQLTLSYGPPEQTLASWEQELSTVLAQRPDRLCLVPYAPAGEPSALTRAQVERYQVAHHVLVTAGYRSVGAAHFALPTDELATADQNGTLTRTFHGYSVNGASDVAAVGANAVSDVGGAYARNLWPLPGYTERIEARRYATGLGFARSADDERRRAIIQKLTCDFCVDLDAELESEFAAELERLRPYEDDGLVVRRGSWLELTLMGRFFAGNVASLFDAYAGG